MGVRWRKMWMRSVPFYLIFMTSWKGHKHYLDLTRYTEDLIVEDFPPSGLHPRWTITYIGHWSYHDTRLVDLRRRDLFPIKWLLRVIWPWLLTAWYLFDKTRSKIRRSWTIKVHQRVGSWLDRTEWTEDSSPSKSHHNGSTDVRRKSRRFLSYIFRLCDGVRPFLHTPMGEPLGVFLEVDSSLFFGTRTVWPPLNQSPFNHRPRTRSKGWTGLKSWRD